MCSNSFPRAEEVILKPVFLFHVKFVLRKDSYSIWINADARFYKIFWYYDRQKRIWDFIRLWKTNSL